MRIKSFCLQLAKIALSCVVFYCVTLPTAYAQTVHILFDATKGEMAGNADWVIDADQTNLGVGAGGAYLTSSGHQSNPQQLPTPAQSGITPGTVETYWTGALSAWAVDCAKRGYEVETLPWNGEITYGNTSNAQDLGNYQVYIIDEPNLVFSADEKTAIIQFVQNGGSLFIISDHNGSDRNGDGWDSPNIWNDFFFNNSVAVNPFGITFDLSDFSQTTSNISAGASDSIIHGPMGNVSEVQWSGGTTMTFDMSKNPTLKGVVYKSGSTAGGATNVMVAYGRYGNGKIAAIGDSSPTDDGTGNLNCTLYTGYTGDAAGNHRLLLMNITIWLATQPGAARVNTTEVTTGRINLFPNPSTGEVFMASDHVLSNVSVVIYDMEGREIQKKQLQQLGRNEQIAFTLTPGLYLAKVISAELSQTLKLIVQ